MPWTAALCLCPVLSDALQFLADHIVCREGNAYAVLTLRNALLRYGHMPEQYSNSARYYPHYQQAYILQARGATYPQFLHEGDIVG